MKRVFAPYIGQIKTARQLIRHRNILLGLPIKKIANIIPFGYELDTDKEGWLRPVDKELQALYFARTFHSRSTLDKIAKWITEETGRPISTETLRIILRTRPPLSTYLLPLHDRLSIATCTTEERAIEIAPQGIEWQHKGNIKSRTDFIKSRNEAARVREQAKRTQREENNLPTKPRPAN